METLENVPLCSHVYYPVRRRKNKELFKLQGNCVSTVMMAIFKTTDDRFANFYFFFKRDWKTRKFYETRTKAVVESCLRQYRNRPCSCQCIIIPICVGIFFLLSFLPWQQTSLGRPDGKIHKVWCYTLIDWPQIRAEIQVCLYKTIYTNVKPITAIYKWEHVNFKSGLLRHRIVFQLQ